MVYRDLTLGLLDPYQAGDGVEFSRPTKTMIMTVPIPLPIKLLLYWTKRIAEKKITKEAKLPEAFQNAAVPGTAVSRKQERFEFGVPRHRKNESGSGTFGFLQERWAVGLW